MTEIIVALIGAIALITTAYLSNKVRTSKHKLSQAEGELKLQHKALSFGNFIEEWAGTHEELQHLLENSSIDRFLILRAWNGKLAPRWTTAVYQMRLGEQEPMSYVHFELDTDYVSRLKEITIRNLVQVTVAELPDCAVKRVYEAEGVKHAVWCHISSQEVDGTDTVAHTYCSFATHGDEPIDPKVVTRCSILSGRLKGIAMNFQEKS